MTKTKTLTGLFAVSLVFGTVSCQRDGGSAESLGAREMSATLRVEAGHGRLAGGEEYRIAQWQTGRIAPAAAGSAKTSTVSEAGYYAKFRGQDGGPLLDLNISGLRGAGTYACGGAASAAVAVELRVDVNNAYKPANSDPCRVDVDRVVDGVMEGRYTATLRHTGNSLDEMIISGTFRASRPPAIAAAAAPKIVGLR